MILFILLGIAANWLDISDATVFFIYLLSIVLLTNYYRVKRVTYIDGGKAGWLSALVAGLGQVYSKQTVFGIIYTVLHLIILGLGRTEMMEGTHVLIGWLLLMIVSIIHANLVAGGLNERLAKEALQKLAVAKYRRLVPSIELGAVFAPDTNILMHEQLALIAAYYDSNAKLYISKQVIKELDGLKNNSDASVRKRAQYAFDVLELYQEANRIVFIEVPHYNYLKKHKLTGGPDEKIIASCLQQLHEKQVPIVFLSNDKGARLLARNSGVPIQTMS
ncbi:PIN domain-containing protein [Oceanobacillus halotolerans]|uniref:PIN domain-containing protein n=1 Tax=Oceanobacillus halotolerans TaxID=2663380 RepID=UPI0013DB5F3E|nr:PIN domain-containing protein [Oceanobacillus halotolerans]